MPHLLLPRGGLGERHQLSWRRCHGLLNDGSRGCASYATKRPEPSVAPHLYRIFEGDGYWAPFVRTTSEGEKYFCQWHGNQLVACIQETERLLSQQNRVVTPSITTALITPPATPSPPPRPAIQPATRLAIGPPSIEEAIELAPLIVVSSSLRSYGPSPSPSPTRASRGIQCKVHADKKSVQEDLKDHSSCSTQTKEPDQPTSDDLKAEDKAEDTTDGVVKDESPLNILRQAKSSIVTLDDATVVQHIEATELSPDTQAIFAILRATALGIGVVPLVMKHPNTSGPGARDERNKTAERRSREARAEKSRGCLSGLFHCLSIDPASSEEKVVVRNPGAGSRQDQPRPKRSSNPTRTHPTGPRKPGPKLDHDEPLYPPSALGNHPPKGRRPSDIFRTDSETHSFLQRLPQEIELRELTQLSMIARNGPTAKDCPGFLYLFWPKPVGGTGSALLNVDKRAADRTFRLARSNALLDGVSRVMFKIGKALQPRARVSTWAAKCKEDYELIRQYPEGLEPMPYHGLVEALVKAQLRPRNVLKECQKCVNANSGKPVQHREWFAVDVEEGARGVKMLDEVIRTWMQWSFERHGDQRPESPRARC